MAIGDITGQVQPDLARPGFFDFNINGIATSKQMERLIDLTATMAKRITKGKDTPEGKAELERIKALQEGTAETKQATKSAKTLSEATSDLSDHFDSLSRVAHGSFKGLQDLSYFLDHRSKLALGLTGFGTMLGALNGYADSLGKAMQMGVGGDIMTFAVASKMAGLKLESFTKALSESGGGFASLGSSAEDSSFNVRRLARSLGVGSDKLGELSSNATDGAITFGKLVNEVRVGTERFGNLGLSVDELAIFTAQQVKVAVSQGFKGKQAQEQVRANSIALAKDLQSLSESTGKSVVELAAAANKLATDPLIATMVATTRENRKEVSKAVLGFAASIKGVFGEAGDVLGADALKAASAGLPLAMTESGKNLLIASTPLYNEFTRLAQGVQQGRQVTEEDRDRLRKLALQEVETRGQQIKTLSMLEGPAGDAARQILKLAQEARSYNTEEGKERKKQIESSRKFVAERNKLEASLQQALIPVLELLNKIDWNFFYSVLNGATKVFSGLLYALSPITKLLGATGAGSLIGGLLALAGVVGIVKAAFAAFAGISGAARGVFAAGTGGGLSSIFGRRANGQTPTTPLWVRSVDSMFGGRGAGTLAGGMTAEQLSKYRDLRRKGLTAAEARAQAMAKTGLLSGAAGLFGKLGTGGKLAAGGLLAGSLVGMGGDALGGDMGTIMNLLGSGLDIATVMALYKSYGKSGIQKIVAASGSRGAGASFLLRNARTVSGGLAGGIIGGTVAQAAVGQAESTAGTVGNIAGSIGGGAIGGVVAGRFLGGVLGAWAGPVGVAIGSAIGGVAGQIIGDKLLGDSVKDTAVSANEQLQSDNDRRIAETAKMNSQIAELVDYQRAANSINAQALTYQRDTSRNIKNLPLPN